MAYLAATGLRSKHITPSQWLWQCLGRRAGGLLPCLPTCRSGSTLPSSALRKALVAGADEALKAEPLKEGQEVLEVTTVAPETSVSLPRARLGAICSASSHESATLYASICPYASLFKRI